jgi:hypothetical protein
VGLLLLLLPVLPAELLLVVVVEVLLVLLILLLGIEGRHKFLLCLQGGERVLVKMIAFGE